MNFLSSVASKLLQHYNGNLADVTIVFPNKRAALFLNDALTELSDAPLWSPRYVTIRQLFVEHSHLQLADSIDLVFRLHKVYCRVTGSTEPLDQFWGWGELLISDFDDIDKHLADASQIFSLLKDIHELDAVDYLSDHQKEELQRFFSNFTDEHHSILRERFLTMWSRLGDIYEQFRQELLADGMAYEGLLYRETLLALENENPSTSSGQAHNENDYIFIGFSHLTPVEERIMKVFERKTKDENENPLNQAQRLNHLNQAQRLNHLRSALPLSERQRRKNHLNQAQRVTLLSTTTSDLQARYVTTWLTPERIKAGRRTAIVLADESLLETVMCCLPSEVENVNITIGYPLFKTHVALEVMKMCKDRHYRHLPPLQLLEKLRDSSLTPAEGGRAPHDLRSSLLTLGNPSELDCSSLNRSLDLEARYRMMSILERLQPYFVEETSTSLLISLLNQLIRSTTIPFHGEPLEGIQIMGILETRNLDFDNILMLSCNEGNIPSKVSDSSFIPYFVRKAYGLTTIDHKVDIFANHFFRLLNGVKDITFLYDSSTADNKTGEMSRFLLQLMIEDPELEVKPLGHGANSANSSNGSNGSSASLGASGALGSAAFRASAEKEPSAAVKPVEGGRAFSPSSLASYLRCQRLYYYKKVLGIKEDDNTNEGEMDQKAFGIVFHNSIEAFYRQHIGREMTREFLTSVANEKGLVVLQTIVDEVIKSNFGNDTPRGVLLYRDVVVSLLRMLLRYDAKHAPFTVVDLEKKVEMNTPQGVVYGYIDRLDKVRRNGQDVYRVIDYKTGRLSSTRTLAIDSVPNIFDTEAISKHSDYFLQALLYTNIISSQTHCSVEPHMIYVQHTNEKNYTSLLTINKEQITDSTPLLPEFYAHLQDLMLEINNKQNNPQKDQFPKTDITDRCNSCAFADICKFGG